MNSDLPDPVTPAEAPATAAPVLAAQPVSEPAPEPAVAPETAPATEDTPPAAAPVTLAGRALIAHTLAALDDVVKAVAPSLATVLGGPLAGAAVAALSKAVLGKEYVENSLKNADDFSLPMQELSTEYCWGYVWNRPGLELRERSIINIAMISALNRPHELRLHVQGALRNGVTKDEIREILLHVGIYAGIPCSVDSFRIAREAIADYNHLDVLMRLREH